MAEGADLPYRDVLTVNFMHLPPVIHDDCSTVILCEGIISFWGITKITKLGSDKQLISCNVIMRPRRYRSFRSCIQGVFPD
ncbi:MAG: hypothetical protein ACTSVZ_07970, partial [Promethearchaeota archaeon]